MYIHIRYHEIQSGIVAGKAPPLRRTGPRSLTVPNMSINGYSHKNTAFYPFPNEGYFISIT